MRAARLQLAAMTKENRHQVMADFNDAVNAAGGWIVNHTLFSNIATTFHFALPASRLPGLIGRLHSHGVHFDADSLKAVEDRPAPAGSDDEIQVFANVTFVHDEPDLRRDVPSVPG